MKIAFHKRPFISVLITLMLSFLLAENGFAAARREVKIPDVPPYRTLKCDFHTHTVFSDGQVWPTVRVEEAWCDGLDAIAITDHIEYKPHKGDVRPDNERAYEIARAASDKIGLIIIRGAEITRDMPPGHWNAIFLKDIKALDTSDFNDVMKNALSQGAFIFWNHPGWEGQQPDGVPRWYPEHTEAYEKGWMQGIEIVNENSYYPLAHKWALEKKLAIVGNSDIHDPTCLGYDSCKGEHRPITLVFAKDSNENGIKEALQAHRTAVYYKNSIIGDERYLRAIFEKSVQMPEAEVTIKGSGKAYVRIRNISEVDFELAAEGPPEYIKAPGNITLYGDRTVMLGIEGKGGAISGTKKISIPYKVKNLSTAPDEHLRVELPLTINFVAVKPK